MWWFARSAAAAAAAALVVLAPSTSAVAARTPAPVVSHVSISMSGELVSPYGWKGCLATVSADVTSGSRLTLTWHVGMRGTAQFGNTDFTVRDNTLWSTQTTAGVTHYTLTQQPWFNNTTEVVYVYATLSEGRRVVATSTRQTVSLICPSPFPPI